MKFKITAGTCRRSIFDPTFQHHLPIVFSRTIILDYEMLLSSPASLVIESFLKVLFGLL